MDKNIISHVEYHGQYTKVPNLYFLNLTNLRCIKETGENAVPVEQKIVLR